MGNRLPGRNTCRQVVKKRKKKDMTSQFYLRKPKLKGLSVGSKRDDVVDGRDPMDRRVLSVCLYPSVLSCHPGDSA